MINAKYLHDFGITFRQLPDPTTGAMSSNAKGTLALSPTGDLQLVNGKNKLVTQLMRKFAASNVKLALNDPNVPYRQIRTLVTLILKNFKQVQVDETDAVDPNFLGFTVYRKGGPVNYSGDSSDTFTKITKSAVTYKFVDIELLNGFTYSYAISKAYKNGLESTIIEQIDIKPSAFTTQQKVVRGTNLVGLPGDRSATLYVDTNRLYKQSELLDVIGDIIVSQDPSDPRRFIVNVSVQNVLGELISFSVGRQSVI